MTRSLPRVLHLTLLTMLASAALGVGNANAANEFLLLHPGNTFAEEGVTEETFTGEIESQLFNFVMPNLPTSAPYEITCKGVTVTGKVMPTVLHAKLVFENCHTFYIVKIDTHYFDLNLANEYPCIVKDQSFEAKLKAVPVLHNDETFLLWMSLEGGKPFATVQFTGLECEWPKVDFTGTVVSKLTQLNIVKQLFDFNSWTTLLFQEKGLPGDTLSHNGEAEAYLEGSLYELKLTGDLAGEAWGAH